MDALGLERAHIHGGSMGSFIAVNFAARYPGRVDKLLLGAGAVGRCDRMGVLQFRILAEPGPGLRGWRRGSWPSSCSPTPSRVPSSTARTAATRPWT